MPGKKEKQKKAKNPMKSRSRKDKGLRLQEEVVEALVNELGINPLDIKSTPSGQPGCDVYLSAAARDIFPFGVECKNTESIRIWDALKQCRTNALASDMYPLLVFRRNHTEAHVCLRLSDFLKLYKKTTQVVSEQPQTTQAVDK